MLRLACLAADRLWLGLKTLPSQAARSLGGAIGNQPADNRRLALNLAVILPVSTLTWLGLPGVTLVMSPSIDAWAVRRAPGPIHKGDLVEFMLYHPIAGPKPLSVTKRALCLPGERLREIERLSVDGREGTRGWYYCGRSFLGASRPFGRDGRPLPHLRWGDRPIPPGFVYVGSDRAGGFDSRYFGPVRLESLTRMERIL
ncbi:S26 family signal peptidase [Sphingobium sp.]|uniref:S26 family signal peptidase n=1 Tax=Sphingobium sp. TaxID=1912891 RepID=UPI002C2D00EC|nr:S26 family signal peptidase [Sphingobium sp.]HUD95015.1 S26 family signal peptidase [Sphingobium sp.]